MLDFEERSLRMFCQFSSFIRCSVRALWCHNPCGCAETEDIGLQDRSFSSKKAYIKRRTHFRKKKKLFQNCKLCLGSCVQLVTWILFYINEQKNGN